MPWGYPEGVDMAKNHMSHLFGPRLEAWTTKSQNRGFHQGHQEPVKWTQMINVGLINLIPKGLQQKSYS